MRASEYERTRKERDRKEKRRLEKETARLNEQYVSLRLELGCI